MFIKATVSLVRVLVGLVFIVTAAHADSSELPVFRLLLQWTPQSQFAGYYMAVERGLYKQHGVEVEIIEGGPEYEPADYLREGKTEFAILFLTGALEAYNSGVKLIHLAQVVNRCNQMIVGWKRDGINDLQDLDKKRVSVWVGGFRPAYTAVFTDAGIEPVIVPQYYSITLFLRGGVSACTAMEYNEYHTLYQSGVEYDDLFAWRLRDGGFGFPEDGIYCTENTFRQWPEACRAVAAASLEGWQLAAENPSEALDLVMRHVYEANVLTNRTHMHWMLQKVLASIFPSPKDDWEYGQLGEKEFRETVATLKQGEVIQSAPDYEVFLGKGGASAP